MSPHVSGRPDPEMINTCYVERHNWDDAGRCGASPSTKRSNGFSRKLQNHMAMVALFMYAYNFVQPHRSLTRKGGPVGHAGDGGRRGRLAPEAG